MMVCAVRRGGKGRGRVREGELRKGRELEWGGEEGRERKG